MRQGSQSLLERAAELQAVAGACAGAAASTGELVLIEGPAGIGKTALLRACEADGVLTLRARGAQLEQDYAWGVVRQLFEAWLRALPDSDRDELLGGAAGPARSALGDTALGDEQPFAALHGLYWLAVNAAERAPLVLVVDDVHWCDDASLRWLAYLGQRVEGSPISLGLAARRRDPGADRQPLLALGADPAATVIRPEPLSESATGELVAERLA